MRVKNPIHAAAIAVGIGAASVLLALLFVEPFTLFVCTVLGLPVVLGLLWAVAEFVKAMR